MKKENIENITEKWLDKKAQRLSVLVDLQTLIRQLLAEQRQETIEDIENFIIQESGKSGRKEILNYLETLKKNYEKSKLFR